MVEVQGRARRELISDETAVHSLLLVTESPLGFELLSVRIESVVMDRTLTLLNVRDTETGERRQYPLHAVERTITRSKQ